MKFLKSAAAIAVLAAVAAAPAQAAISGNAIGSFSYVLFDMDATDGIDPSISFETRDLSAGTYVFSNGHYYSDYKDSDAPIQSASVSQGYSSGTASATGTSLAAGGNSLGSTGFGEYASFSSGAYSTLNFNLTANTVVVFKMNYQLTANTSAYEDNEYVSSQVGMDLRIDYDFESEYGDSEGSNNSQYVSASLSAYEGESLSKNSRLLISYASDRASSGYLNLNAGTYGGTSVSAVPEPETYAMLLAGLGLIGTVARRRKAKQA